MTHGLWSDLWWNIPLRILLGQFWDTFRIPPDQVSPSHTHRCPGAFGTFHILPTGIHGLCFGSYLSGPLPQRSLLLGPLSRVHFGESLVVRLYSEIDQIHLSSEAQCVSHHLPPVDCHNQFELSVYTTEHVPLEGRIKLFYHTRTILRINCISSFHAGNHFLCIKMLVSHHRSFVSDKEYMVIVVQRPNCD